MSLTKGKRFIIGYLVFVVLPAAGIVACLKYGQRLKAPAAIEAVPPGRSQGGAKD
ncbi:MAG: hypothetical protein LAP21_02090 [Acidobacteriia bacterium]|nr:hypothetical protein [Terriglobia bacterium]